MAHPRIVAQRQAIGFERLQAAARKLVKQHGLTEQGKALEGIKDKDPAFAQMLQTEALADLLEGLADAPATKEEATATKDLGLRTKDAEGDSTSGPKSLVNSPKSLDEATQQVESELEAETGKDFEQTGTTPPTLAQTDKSAPTTPKVPRR